MPSCWMCWACGTVLMDDAIARPPASEWTAGETPSDTVARIGALSEQRRTRFDGGEMVWRVWGQGRPIVLFHGGYGTWTHWIKNVVPLSRHFQVFVADMPSHGDSDTLPGRPSRDAMADAIGAGLDQLFGKEQAYDIAGFSMGANLSAAIALAHGGKLDNLVVVGPGGLGVSSQKITGLQRWRPDLQREVLDRRHRNNLGVIMFHDNTRIDDLAVHLQRENGLRMRFRISRSGINTLLKDNLPKVQCRLTCIWGDGDVYAVGGRDERISVMRQSHPDLETRIVADAGHWVMYEQAEAFNAALLQSLGVIVT